MKPFGSAPSVETGFGNGDRVNSGPCFRHTHVLALVLALVALAIGGSGCIVVPIYSNRVDSTVRTNVAPVVVSVLGSTNISRSDVLLQFGEPDEVSATERQFRFHTERIKWDIYWAVASQYNAASGDIELRRYYDLVLRFDERGKLVEGSWLEGPTPKSQKQTANWSASASAPESGP